MNRPVKLYNFAPSPYAKSEIVGNFKKIQKSLFSQTDLFRFLSLVDYQGNKQSAISRQINKGLTQEEQQRGIPAKTPTSIDPETAKKAMDFTSAEAEDRICAAVKVLRGNRRGSDWLKGEDLKMFLDNTLREFARKLELNCYDCMFDLFANAPDDQTRLRGAAAILYTVFICYLSGNPSELNLCTFQQWIQVKQGNGTAGELVDLSRIRFFAQFSDEDLIFPTHYEDEILHPIKKCGVQTVHIDVDYESPRRREAVSSYCGAYIKASAPVDLREYRGIAFDICGGGAVKTVYLEVKAYDGSPHETFKLNLSPELVHHLILILEFRESVPRRGAIELTFVIKEASSFDPDVEKRQGFFEISNLRLEKNPI